MQALKLLYRPKFPHSTVDLSKRGRFDRIERDRRETQMRKCRLNFVFFFFYVSLVFFVLLTLLAGPSSAEDRPRNVLLITIDTLRPDRLSCYGSEYCQTPGIDAMAAKGVLFKRAFAHTPTTLPSHTNILLGTTPPYHGIHDNSKFKVSGDFLTLAEHLKNSGYSTAAFIGAFPLDSRFGLSQGFDVYDASFSTGSSPEFSPPERKAEKVVRSALEWIRGQHNKWFCWIHVWDPHAPYLPPEPFLDTYKQDPYSGEVAYVDSELGKLFGDMQNNGMLSDTLLVLTADHGESLGEHGESTHSYFAYNSTLWVPLIMTGPGIPTGKVDDYVCHIDIFPSICDILGIEKPSFLQGVSLFAMINGKGPGKRAIYFESLSPHYNVGAAPLRGFIREEKKFIDSPVAEFYDLTKDFDERKNLALQTDLSEPKEKLNEMIENLSSSRRAQNLMEVDRDTLEKLRSLGYVSLSSPKIKARYGPEDDVKALLPYQQKLDEAIVLKDEGKVAEFITLLKNIIGEKKDLVQAYIYLSRTYKEQGRLEEALELLEQAVKNNPHDYNIVSNYGILLIDTRKYDQGIAMLEQGLGLVDFDPLTWNYLGFAHWQKGEEEKALEYYRKSLAIDDTFAMTYHSLGVFYFSVFSRTKKWEDYERSLEYFKTAIEHDPGLFIAYKALGLGYKVGGRIDAAISVWEQALGLNPADHSVVLNLGKAYLETGNKIKALQYFEKYLRSAGTSLGPEERQKIQALIQQCKR
jgi:arylsulfatase A-like enzyme/Tfp pilus assembly protein PilF